MHLSARLDAHPSSRLASGIHSCIDCAMRALIITLVFALPAHAQDTPLTAKEFQAEVEGKTLSYSTDGIEYGAEIYYKNRRVLWSFLGDECFDGYWYASDSLICFAYESFAEDQCFYFYRRGGQLIARFWRQELNERTYAISPRSEPLICPGPKVGA